MTGGIAFGGGGAELLDRHAGEFRWRCAYDILGVSVVVQANRPGLVEEGMLFFEHFAAPRNDHPNADAPMPRTLAFHLVAASGDVGYAIVLPTGVLRVPTREGVIGFLGSNVMHHVLSVQQHLVVLHAGSVAWDGSCYVCLGDSGAGKTTLTAALVSRGFAYLSDDLAPFDPRTLEVRPFPRYLQLRAGTARLLAAAIGREWVHGARRLPEEDAWLVGPHALGARIQAKACRLAGIVFLRENWGGDCAVTRISSLHSLPRVVEHWANRYYLPDEERRAMLQDLVRAVARLPCYELSVGDVFGAASLLQDLPARTDEPDGDAPGVELLLERVRSAT
jgi:hypothetical protein